MTDIIQESFPHETFNPGQKEAIIKAIAAIKRGTKHVVIAAPTGTGKSAIAITINNVLTKIDFRNRTTLITGNKSLQDQYVNDYGNVFDLKGKQNYRCPKSTKQEQVYFNSSKCKTACSTNTCGPQYCEYVIRRDEWLDKSQFRLTNSTFAIKAPPQLIANDTTKTPIMIIDECHELPNTLIDNSTVYISKGLLKQTEKTYGEAFVKMFNDVMTSVSKIKLGNAFKTKDINMEPVDAFYNRMVTISDSITDRLKDGEQNPSLMIILEELNGVLGTMETFVKLKEGEWILTKYENNKEQSIIEIKPIYAHQVAYRGIFCKSDHFVHMSATICGFNEYCFNLGINPKEAVFIEVDNPIPVESRPVVIDGRLKINMKTDPKDIARKVDEIISKNSLDTNGVIHTVSFKLAENIKDHSKYSKRMVISNNREEILSLLNEHNGWVILSPSIETGLDLKGKLAEWQIIAKVPFGYLGDPFIALNMKRDPNWYNRQAILRLIQASGRVVRGMSDFGATYIIDANAIRLINSSVKMIPEWYLDAVDII